MKDRWVITEVIYTHKDVKQLTIPLLFLQSDGQFVLIRHDLPQCLMVKFVKSALLVIPHAQLITHEILHHIPAGIDIDARWKYKNPFKS